jgi:hypothetical protein
MMCVLDDGRAPDKAPLASTDGAGIWPLAAHTPYRLGITPHKRARLREMGGTPEVATLLPRSRDP